jgi:hypothetical protein
MAGYAESILEHAERLDEEVPEDMAHCVAVWWRWHTWLRAKAKGSSNSPS